MPNSNFISQTEGIRIEVWPELDKNHTSAEHARYVYSYRIKIENLSPRVVQLLSRHWIIKDGFNRIEQVIGEGVIGKKPILNTGESFEYSSFCPLPTPTGTMKGSYTFVTPGGEKFEAIIQEFPLIDLSLVN